MANNNSRTSHESEVDGGIKRQKRGPFLPVNEDVGVLADNDDDDDDCDLKQQQQQQQQRRTRSSTAKSTTSVSGGRPPTQPPSSMPRPPAGASSRNDRKRKVDLTADVASSGYYGRSSLPSPRTTTPTEFARRRQRTTAAASGSRRRSSFSPSTSRSTRSNDASNFEDTAAALSTAIPKQQQVRPRSRSASPAASVPRSSSGSGGNSSTTYASPTAKKKMKSTHALSSAMKRPVSSALKKLTEGRRRLIGSSGPGGSGMKNGNNGSNDDDICNADDDDATNRGYKDYTSYEYGVDPTPVKEARRLSSIFHSSSPSQTRLFHQHRDDGAIDAAAAAADDVVEELRTLLIETEGRVLELQKSLENATNESIELAEQLELVESDRDKYRTNCAAANEGLMLTMEKVASGHTEEIQTIETRHLRELSNFEERITELQTSLYDATKESEELAEQLHLVEMERDSFKSRVDALSLELHELRSTRQVETDELQSRMEKIETDRIDELEKIKSDHVKELSQVNTDTLEVLEKMKADHRDEMEKLMSNNNNVLTSIETGHEEELDKIKTGYMKELTTITEAHDRTNATCILHEKCISEMKIKIAQFDMQIQHEKELRIKADEKACEERSERITVSAQLNALVKERYETENELRETIESLRHELSSKDHTIEVINSELKQCKETNIVLQAKEESVQQSLSNQLSMLDASKEEECAHLRGIIASLESKLKVETDRVQDMDMTRSVKVQELEESIKSLLLEKKRMHTLIQELRGNVRVFARIRPYLPNDGKRNDDDDDSNAPDIVSLEDDKTVTVLNPKDSRQQPQRFSFDRVFSPSDGQEAVFEEVSEFVRSALDGYNVCIFSYGQTGSGKTHTMHGTGGGTERGVIPRCLAFIAEHKATEENNGWVFSMEVSFLEIYNETLRDLLRAPDSKNNEECKHDIKVGQDGRRSVTNLTIKTLDPNDRDAVKAVLTLAAKRRATGCTDMNATSSRSHSVFTLNLTARHEEKNQMIRGSLNLIDLAGSERLDRSSAMDKRANETKSINKSLSSLTDVFTAIGQRASHVPYRNSKLTYLLEPALSGDGKTCMIVNVSPTEASRQESICSLRFASKVNACELGKAKRTVEEVTKQNGSSNNQGRNLKSKT